MQLQRSVMERNNDPALLKMLSQISEHEVLKRLASQQLISFTEYTYPRYVSEPAHKLIAKTLDDVIDGKIKRLMIFAPPQHGKQISHDTPVPTPDGWRTHGDLCPGDYVLGRNGEPVRVIAIGPEIMSNRRVTFGDNTTIDCHARHEWLVHSCDRHHVDRVYETDEIERAGLRGGKKQRARYQVDGYQEIKFAKRKLPIAPYVLGVWLGDGTAKRNCITSAKKDIKIHRAFEELGYHATGHSIHKTTGVHVWYYRRLYGELKETGLFGNKHIPDAYLTASVDQRLELLAGLLDTDGYVYARNGRITFTSCDEMLIRDVVRLVSSLGWQASTTWFPPVLSSSGIQGKKPVCQLGFNPTKKIPCRLERKKSAQKVVEKVKLRSVVDISPIEPKPGRCIQVEGGVYMVGDTFIPTHNSELASVRFPAYWLGKRPDDPVLLCSYGASLAESKSWLCRQVIESHQFADVFPQVYTDRSSRARSNWRIDGHRGEMVAAGVGGPITGHGAMLGVIDDPFENYEQARSAVMREKVWNWYREVFRTRVWEHGSIVIIMTRWHEADLCGKLLDRQPDQWHVLRLPAIAETQKERNEEARKTGQREGQPDPLNREPGEPLCPERFSLKALRSLEADVGVRGWYSQYQGSPRAPEGNVFKRDWFETLPELPDGCQSFVRYWDKAGTAADGNYTAGVLMARKNRTYYIVDVVRGQWSASRREQVIRQTAMSDKLNYGRVKIWVEQEGGSGGKESAEGSVKNLSGFVVQADVVSGKGSKILRAEPLESQARVGNVKLIYGRWNQTYLDELTAFPNGANDDQVDGSSGAFSKLFRKGSYFG